MKSGLEAMSVFLLSRPSVKTDFRTLLLFSIEGQTFGRFYSTGLSLVHLIVGQMLESNFIFNDCQKNKT